MKKLSVLFFALTLVSCGGDSFTQDQAAAIQMAYQELIPISFDTTAASEDDYFGEVAACVETGTPVETETSYSIDFTMTDCPIDLSSLECTQNVDDITMSGTTSFDVDVTMDGEELSAISYDLEISATINGGALDGMTCDSNLSVDINIANPEDASFTGKVCGVDFEDLATVTLTDEEICAAFGTEE